MFADLFRRRSGSPQKSDRLRPIVMGAVRSIWTRAAAALGAHHAGDPTISPQQFVTALYRGLLGREPDRGGLGICVREIERGRPLVDLVSFFVSSGEYRERLHEAAAGGNPPAHAENPTLVGRLPDANESISRARPNVLFLQTADPYHYYDMLVETSRTVRAYCHQHGFRYESYIGIKRGFYSWHAAYNRIIILKELRDAGYTGWVFYIDADAWIGDMGFDLSAYLQDKSNYAAIFVDPGIDDVWYHMNNGIFLVNLAKEDARSLIDRWFDEFIKISTDKLRLATDWDDLPHDQDLLHVVLYSNQAFRSVIYLESPHVLGWEPGFVRQFTRGGAKTLAERKQLIKAKVDELLGAAPAIDTAAGLSERDARVIISVLYKTLLGTKAKWEPLDLYTPVLRDDGLQYGLQRIVESLTESEEFTSRYASGTDTELTYQQAKIIGTVLYRSLFEREPDWHALNTIPATLREKGLEVGLRTIIDIMIQCDEFRIRQARARTN